MAVLRDVKRDQEMELERLRAENAALKAAKGGSFKLKIGMSGGLSAYFGSRYPVTLYYDQWHTLLDHKEEILAFLAANKSNMKMKD